MLAGWIRGVLFPHYLVTHNTVLTTHIFIHSSPFYLLFLPTYVSADLIEIHSKHMEYLIYLVASPVLDKGSIDVETTRFCLPGLRQLPQATASKPSESPTFISLAVVPAASGVQQVKFYICP